MNRFYFYKLRDTENEKYNEILVTEDECKDLLQWAVNTWYDRDNIDFENETEELMQSFCNCFDKSKIDDERYTELFSIICGLKDKINFEIEISNDMIEYFLDNLGIKYTYLNFDRDNTIDI